MFTHRIATTSVVLALVAAALGSDITDEVRGGFRMGGSLLPRQTKGLQSFSGSLGGAKAQSITQSSDQKRPFEVNGDTFTDFRSAANRACDNQKNACADMANGSKKGDFTVGECDKQNGSGSICNTDSLQRPRQLKRRVRLFLRRMKHLRAASFLLVSQSISFSSFQSRLLDHRLARAVFCLYLQKDWCSKHVGPLCGGFVLGLALGGVLVGTSIPQV
ncbi:hypothetical protein RB601_000878 [Gaeumannomyces tritici]